MRPCLPVLLLRLALLVLACRAWSPSGGDPCPPACRCLDSRTVDCRGRGLPRVPSPFPLDARQLLAAGNAIREIPADFFLLHHDLAYLDFRNNSLERLAGGAFRGSGSLVYLDLSYNNLSRLDAGAFQAAPKLAKLSLGHNRLARVDAGAFRHLEQLQVLELHDNRLRTLSAAALEALPNLRALRLDGNPWRCDCDFAGLFRWLEENQAKLQGGLSEIQCTVPVEEITVFLSELTEASFRDCKFSLSLTDLIIIIFSGVAVSIAAIASSFLLALLVNCFQRCAPSKDDDEDDDDE
ncbi:hypothetical protein JRQ81_009896 [Phrynocephalus forsythii]|uniref:Leucine-rich repeat-containing protein 38 n=1 Tax=Phrynocephalus forsythii TaxID=171643 RepID=A0A9Q1ARJ8_9SAUR|nr:hypothetical protein JRQ81_009896 [Phrynocephalus forsythii]